MSSETARMVLIGITAATGLFWLVTAAGFAALTRPRTGTIDDPGLPPIDPAFFGDGGVRTGSVEVSGRADDLSARLAGALGRTGLAGFAVRVLDRKPDRVNFEILTGLPIALAVQAQSGRGRAVRGEVDFRGFGGRTRAGYAVAVGSGGGLLFAGRLFLLLGLAAIAVAFGLAWTFAVDHPNPGVRGQVVQAVQAIHLIWPPWLFGAIYRRTREALPAALEVLLGNLPYVG